MESPLSTTTSTTVAQINRIHLPVNHIRPTTAAPKPNFPTLPNKFASATPFIKLKNVGVGLPLFGHRLACVSSDVASGGGGDGGGVYGGGGGGDGGGDGAEVKTDPMAVGVDDASSDVIILDVGGMTCGGCCAKVKRILESQLLVSAATVNLTTETAIVWPVAEAKVTPNWQRVLGEELAKHLTTCGFNSNFREKQVTVMGNQERQEGLLTPNATMLMEKIKKDASHYHVQWNGGDLYQVSGKPNHYRVVDLTQKECSCRKWELTGMPCCHGVAAIWFKATNGERVGALEAWVHPIHTMENWKAVYAFKLNPINDRSLWKKTSVPVTLTAPKHHTPVGRPKKARKRSFLEREDLTGKTTLSRKSTQGKCNSCGGIGHNRRTCRGQGRAGEGGSSQGHA